MKALVVDDDAVSRMAMEDLLNRFDSFKIVEAEDGEAAWEQLSQGLRPVICCCDIRMPKLSGIDLLKRVKSTPEMADIPFVLVSSASDRETVAQAIELGVAGYILKPFHAMGAIERLGGILKNIREKNAEKPATTMQRLNIAPARLIAYLATLNTQLESAATEIQALLARGEAEEAKVRLDRLHTGCDTLGLWRAAASIRRIDLETLKTQETGTVFSEALSAVAHQTGRVKSALK